jgi:hypothetical protein
MVVHAFFTMPETKGKSLVNVEKQFDDGREIVVGTEEEEETWIAVTT